MNPRLLIVIAAGSLLVASIASAQRKATTQVQKTFIWKTAGKDGRPLPSLFWLNSGKRGQEVTKTWELKNGVKITQTKGLDESGKQLYSERVVVGKGGHRNSVFVGTPSKTTGFMGNSTWQPQMIELGGNPISDTFAGRGGGKHVTQTKSYHQGDLRMWMSREGTSLKDVSGKPYSKPGSVSKSKPIKYKGGGPLMPLPIYE